MTRRPFVFTVTLTGEALVYAETLEEAQALVADHGVLLHGPHVWYYYPIIQRIRVREETTP